VRRRRISLEVGHLYFAERRTLLSGVDVGCRCEAIRRVLERRLKRSKPGQLIGLSEGQVRTLLVVGDRKREYRASLAPVPDDQAAARGAEYRSRSLREEEVVRPLRDANGALVGRVVIEHAMFEADAGGWRATNADGLLVLY
jgi:hypothetical protein